MILVTADFESYYDAKYSLKSKDLSTSQYIRDSRFEVISCAIKIDDGEPVCYFGMEDIKSAFAKIDWANATFLAHHAHFDGLILSHHFGITPKRYACTLSMARALHPKAQRNSLEEVAKHYNKVNKLPMPDFKGKHLKDLTNDELEAIRVYNIGDIQSCYEIYQEMLKGFPESELDLIDITVRMFADPVLLVDIPRAQKELEREQTTKAAAILASGVDIKTLSSTPKFVAALKSLGMDAPVKDSPSVAGKTIPAIAKTDEAFQALLNHPNEKIVKLVAGRLAAKSTLSESRAARLIDYGSNGKKLPIYLGYAMAHTHRWAGGDKLNPQNFKQKKKVGGDLQACIIAPKDHVQVVVDSAQIEARVVAWLANEEWILDAFRENRDLYSEFASEVLGRPITKADIADRFVFKTAILGLGFGMGASKFQTTALNQSISQGLEPCRLTKTTCYNIVDAYRIRCLNIQALWDVLGNEGINAMMGSKPFTWRCLTFVDGKIHLPNGLSLLYPDLKATVSTDGTGREIIFNASYWTGKNRTGIWGGYITENVVQALARIIVADVMRKLAKKYRIVMMKHDEIVFLCHKDEGQAALDYALKLMSIPPVWAPDLPLSAEGGFDVSYIK